MRDTKQEVLSFWFEESQPAQWFQKNEAFDADIRDRFLTSYEMAARDMCREWTKEADGVLALCLLLDQFPRNMFRDTPKAFETDDKALLIAKESINKGLDFLLVPIKRRFVYLCFEHSENLSDQKRSVQLFETMKDDDPLGYEYALRHYEVIEKFGRFPHRNKALGRKSTEEEKAYLKLPGAGF
ncbi:MAG: DUF924 domain-containing protein [Alphaproteobacteria bacterium]|nr:DUF924 domain-containing protein [Alphaproteobacteria bacterium]